MRKSITPDQFWERVSRGPDCWVWEGSRNRGGYGTLTFKGDYWSAHRFAYVLAYGDIPPGKHILHSCDNPGCVNPSHLRAGTRVDNMQDKVRRGRHFQADQTACKSGHLFDSTNTYITPDGRRNCRTCRRQARRAYRARTKEVI